MHQAPSTCRPCSLELLANELSFVNRSWCALIAIFLFAAWNAFAENKSAPQNRASQYLLDLLRLDTTNPPGNETLVAEYLKHVADAEGIPCELVGPDPRRLNFIARLKGSGSGRPLLLMAHSDVVPADRSQWSVEPFAAKIKDGVVYARGAEDIKSLLAAELAVIVELKRGRVQLNRDVILLAEADEEAGSSSCCRNWRIPSRP